MACVTACPSGVQYDTLIEQTRAQVERRHERTRRDKALRALIFALFPYPRRLRAAARAAARLPASSVSTGGSGAAGCWSGWLAELAAMESLAPRLGKPDKLPERIAATGERRAVVGLLTGCVQGAFFPGVNAATARVLQAEGCDVVVPRQQGCCGALSVHNGREEEALGFARRLVDTFEATGVERVVVNAAGCGSTMKEYAELLADDPAYAERARAFAEKVARRLGDPRRARPRRPAAPARADHRLPRRLPPGARPGRPRPAARAARGDPRAAAEGDRRGRALLRLGRHLQHAQPRAGPRARRPQGPPTSSRPAPSCW